MLVTSKYTNEFKITFFCCNLSFPTSSKESMWFVNVLNDMNMRGGTSPHVDRHRYDDSEMAFVKVSCAGVYMLWCLKDFIYFEFR